MRDGFIKVASATVEISVADTKFNTENIKKQILKADERSINLLVLPELCISGCTCQDLFFNDALINDCLSSLKSIKDFTLGKYPVVVLGLPLAFNNRLFNCAAVLHNGKILGIVPKAAIPAHSVSYFDSADSIADNSTILIDGEHIPFGRKTVFTDSLLPSFKFGIAIGEDVLSIDGITSCLCAQGATIIANPAAIGEVALSSDFTGTLFSAESAKLHAGLIFASADYTESTQDSVFARRLLIYEDGQLLAENPTFCDNDFIATEIDIQRLLSLRKKDNRFCAKNNQYLSALFSQEPIDTLLSRSFSTSPLLPECCKERRDYIEKVLQIQAFGLKKRLEHTNAKTVVLGVSGGLDSTLALLVAIRTMRLLKRTNRDITAITMPCFGTTARTKSNAEKLCELLGIDLTQINISESVLSHLRDIGHPQDQYDATYENAQARERTQVLMDIANQKNGLVLGTGDVSELALGWATYNGDQMSMYSVNASVPKTLVRYAVEYEAENYQGEIKDILLDIVATPVSPELLPASSNGDILQKTEDLVGPYELHDFFLYHMLVGGCSPKKIFRMAKCAFKKHYDDATIKMWLTTFTRRFFTQQFKRSCMPDGPQATLISLSPRAGLHMPSDASFRIWLDEIENL